MPVNDEPDFDAWSAAFKLRNEAEKRWAEAKFEALPSLPAREKDLEEAQAGYDAIVAAMKT